MNYWEYPSAPVTEATREELETIGQLTSADRTLNKYALDSLIRWVNGDTAASTTYSAGLWISWLRLRREALTEKAAAP